MGSAIFQIKRENKFQNSHKLIIMAQVILKHNPTLTKENLLALLSSHFVQKGYKVEFTSLIGADIVIKKSGWTGVSIKLKQKSDSTFLRIGGYAPSMAVRLLLYGLILYIILLPKWKALEKEVVDFISSGELV
jgi:hypothetical protein